MPSRRPRRLRVVPDVDNQPATVVANFVYAVARKLGRGGNPEDQLRGPLEALIEQIGQQFGLDPVPYGEVGLKGLHALALIMRLISENPESVTLSSSGQAGEFRPNGGLTNASASNGKSSVRYQMSSTVMAIAWGSYLLRPIA